MDETTTVGVASPSCGGPGILEPKARESGVPYELVIAIVNLPGPTLLILADWVGLGIPVAKGPWPDDQE